MKPIRSHKDLIVWQKSIDLTLVIYRASSRLGSEERYGLSQQMRRAAVSIASNIAEGAARRHRAEYIQYLHVARGSLAELATQALIATSLGLIGKDNQIDADIESVGRLLSALIHKLPDKNRSA